MNYLMAVGFYAAAACCACGSSPDDELALRRTSCEFAAGAHTAQTLPSSWPQGKAIPIDHFVMVMQENHSFDEYFHALPAYGQPDVDVAAAGSANPDAHKQPIKLHHQPLPCIVETSHGWNNVHKQIDGGAMDGFVVTNGKDGTRAMGYYDASDLPYYYALANTFALGDRYFSSMPGPTWPNRMFAQAATSFGHVSNSPPPPIAEEHSIFDELEDANVSWTIYSDKRVLEEQIFTRLHSEKGDHFATMARFFEDVQAGKLPAFAWVESYLSASTMGTDEHPPADVQLGQHFVASVIEAVMQSESWPHSAIFLNYDEHGGMYDHVPPPPACVPDDTAPKLAASDVQGGFDQLGVRVPLLVVSPYAKRHFVSHETYSHTSLLRLVEARFDLPALTRRDANDIPPYDMFDFVHPPFMTPPSLPAATVDAQRLAACVTLFSGKSGG